MLAHLRDHYDDTFMAPRWSPQEAVLLVDLHAQLGAVRGETASGFVAELRDDVSPLRSSVWHAFGSPCLSAFHPVYLGGVGLPADARRRAAAPTIRPRPGGASSGSSAASTPTRRSPRPFRRRTARSKRAGWSRRRASKRRPARRLRLATTTQARALLHAFVEETLADLDAVVTAADACLDEAAAWPSRQSCSSRPTERR